TIRNTAMTGAPVAIHPQNVHELDNAWYSASFQAPVNPARVFANSFFCNGPTLSAKASPETPNNTSAPAIQNVRSRGIPASSAMATPVTTMSSTPGTVNQP